MSLYEDIVEAAQRQQFRSGGTNARFRQEWIRKQMQNPSAFYQKYGADLKQPTEQVTTPSTVAQTTVPVTEGLGTPNALTYVGERGVGAPYFSTDQNVAGNQGVGSGGVLGTNPYTGQVIGMGLGLAGVPFSNIAGQVISGTPESLGSAVKGTALNYGANALAKNLGISSRVPVGLLASIVSGRQPTKEDIALSALSFTPLGPLASLYSLGKAVNQSMARDYAREGLYGLNPQNTSWGPPTIGSKISGFFGGDTNEMKGEEGTGLVANPALGLGFNVVGMTPSLEGMGGAKGLTLAKGANIPASLEAMFGTPVSSYSASTLADLFGVPEAAIPAPVTSGTIGITDITPISNEQFIGQTDPFSGSYYGWDGGGWDTGISGATDSGDGTGGGFGVGSVGSSGEGEASDGISG